jgi:hypothetical protein
MLTLVSVPYSALYSYFSSSSPVSVSSPASSALSTYQTPIPPSPVSTSSLAMDRTHAL